MDGTYNTLQRQPLFVSDPGQPFPDKPDYRTALSFSAGFCHFEVPTAELRRLHRDLGKWLESAPPGESA